MNVIHDEQLRQLIASAAYVAAHTTAQIMGSTPEMTLQKNAYAKYGNEKVKEWHKKGMLHPRRINGRVWYPAIELMLAAQSDILGLLNLLPYAKDELNEYIKSKTETP